MSAFLDALRARDVELFSELMFQRLHAAHLDVPFAPNHGERCEDYLIQLYRTHPTHAERNVFVSALQGLAANFVEPLIINVEETKSSNAIRDDLFWFSNYLSLLSATDVSPLWHRLNSWLLRLIALADETSWPRDVFLLLLKTAATRLQTHRYLYSLVKSALKGDHFSHELVTICALNDPERFARELLPEYLEQYDEATDAVAQAEEIADTLRNWLRHGSTQLAQDKFAAVLEDIEYFIRRKAKHLKGQIYRNIIMKALASAGINALAAVRIEQAFWSDFPSSDLFKDAALAEFRKKWEDHVRRACGTPPSTAHFALKINQIPYAEAAFVQLYSFLVRLHIKLEMQAAPIAWDRVPEQLSSGNLQLAIYNSCIIKRPNSEMLLLRKCPIPFYLFDGYDLLVTCEFLRKAVTDNVVESSARDLAVRILAGQPYDIDSDAPISKHALRYLMQNARVGVFDYSGLDDELRGFLRKYLELELDSINTMTCDSDQGLEWLLDNKIDIYFGGAIHSDYARRTFTNRVRLLATTKERTEVSLFTTDTFYRENRELTIGLGNICSQIIHLWKEVKAPSTSEAVRIVRADLLKSVNCNSGAPMGFAPDFDALKETLSHSGLWVQKPDLQREWEVFTESDDQSTDQREDYVAKHVDHTAESSSQTNIIELRQALKKEIL